MLTKARNVVFLGIAIVAAVSWLTLPRVNTETKKDNRVSVFWRVTFDRQAGGVHLYWTATDGQQGEKTVTESPFNNADKPLLVHRGTTVSLWVYSFQGTSPNGNKSCQLFFDGNPKGGSVHTQGMTDIKCEETA